MSLLSIVPLIDGAADLGAGVLRRGGHVHALSSQEQALLARLVAQVGTTVDRHELATAIARRPDDVRAVDFAMRRLRAKLEVDPAHPRHLLTVYGCGYRFEPVAAAPEPAEVPAPAESTALPGGRRIDIARREVTVPGPVSVSLTDREANVLAVLLAASGRPVSREVLLQRVWDTRRQSALRYVDQIVHRLRQKLDDDEAAVLRTIPGLGYLLEREQAAVPAGNVEAPADPTFGHDDLYDHVGSLLAAGRVVSVVGPPGAGKSRLAAAVAARQSLPAWRIEISRMRAPTAAALAARVAETMGLPTAQQASVDEIAWALRAAGPALLLLDGADPAAHVLPELIAGWQKRAPEARVLLTSQGALDVPGPRVDIPALPADAAIALFVDRARAARCAWDPAAHAGEIGTICERLDRLPLAIELAAARAGVLTAGQILGQLDHRFALLAQPGRGSLRDALDWSWALLTDAARATLQRLAAFESRFDLDLARHLADGNVLADIDALHRASWLRVEVVDGRAWYRIGESMRAYALAAMRDAGAEREAFERHAAWVVGLTRPRLVEHGLRYGTAIALRPYREDLRAAAERAPDPTTRAWAWVGYACVTQFVGPPGPLPELPIEPSSPAELATLVGVAKLRSVRGRAEQRQTLEALEAKLPLVGDAPRQRGIMLMEIGQVLLDLGDPRCGARLADAVEALVASGAEDVAAMALSSLAIVRRNEGRPQEAEALLHDALSRAQVSGDIFAEAYVRNGLGVHATITGRLEEGEAELRHALAIYGAMAYGPGRNALLNNLGNLQMHLGDLDGAAASYGEAIEAARRGGRQPLLARLTCQLAFVHVGRGELDAAEREVRRSLELHREAVEGRDQGYALGCLGMIAQSQGRHTEAVALYRRAQASFAEAGDRIGVTQHQAFEGTALAEAGDLPLARQTLQRAREAADAGPLAMIVRCAEALVSAVAGEEAPVDATEAPHQTFPSRWLANRVRALRSP